MAISGNSPPRRRRGFAVKELLLVLAFLGSGVAGLKFMDAHINEPHDYQRASERMPMFQREVPVGDEFDCIVSMDNYSRPDSPQLPYYVSRVRFACRNPDPSGAFLLDITAAEAPNWDQIACRTWNLMSADAALDYLHEHSQIAIVPSELTGQNRMSAVFDRLSPDVREVTSLDEPLWRCLPAPLQETGITVVNTEGMGLQAMHEFKGFSLSRLASAIRSAARDDDWTSEDPAALLPPNNSGDPALTADEQHSVAQSLVYRLLDYLPQEDAGYSNAEFAVELTR